MCLCVQERERERERPHLNVYSAVFTLAKFAAENAIAKNGGVRYLTGGKPKSCLVRVLNFKLGQESLTDWEGSVQLTPSFR
jgi:hypothetical protein